MADGVLTFDTKCDVTGVNNASKVVEGSLKRMGGKIKATFGMTDAEKAAQRVQSLKQSYDNATAAVERQKQKVEALRAEIKALQEESARKSSAAALAETPAAAQPLIEQAESLKAQIAEAKENVAVYREKWKNGEGGADKAQSDWLEKVRNLKNEYAEICDKIDQIIAKEQTASAKSGGESQKIEKLNTELVQSEAKLGSLAGRADLAKKKLNSASDAKKVRKLSMAFGNASTSIKRFTRRLSSIVSSALVFTVITKALTKLREQFGATLKTNKQFTDSWAKIKGNLLTAFQPIYEACLPALLQLMNVLEKATSVLASFTSALFGKSAAQMQANAKALNQQANATKKAGKAAKDASRSLAGFDEINQLSDNSSTSSDSSSSETVAPNFNSNISELDATAAKIASYGTLLVGTALLIFGIATASIPAIILGITMIAVGIKLGQETGAFEDTPMWLRQVITWGSILVGIAMLIIGIAGPNIPLIISGLALMGVGIAYGASSGAFEAVAQAVSDLCTKIGTTVSTWWASASKWINDHIVTPVSNAAKWFHEHVIQPIIDFFSPIFEAVIEIGSKILTEVWNIISGIGLAIWSIITKIWEIFLKILEIFGAIAKAFYTYVIEPVLKLFKTYVLAPLARAGSWVYQKVIKPVWDKIVWLKEKAVTIFKSIGTTVVNFISGSLKKAINAVLSGIEWTVNKFINMLNGAIGLINKVIPGSGITKVTPISVPRLATGTYIPANYGEFAAILGDNRREPEVVSPISAMKQAFREALSESGGGAGGSMTINLVIDRDIVGKAFVEYHNGVVARTRMSPLKGVG